MAIPKQIETIYRTPPTTSAFKAIQPDEILSILKRKKEPMNVSDVLRWITSTTSTPLPGMQSVTIVPVEEDSILGAREPTSPGLNSEVVTREMDEEYSPPPVKKTLFGKEQEDVPEDGRFTPKTSFLEREPPLQE